MTNNVTKCVIIESYLSPVRSNPLNIGNDPDYDPYYDINFVGGLQYPIDCLVCNVVDSILSPTFQVY